MVEVDAQRLPLLSPSGNCCGMMMKFEMGGLMTKTVEEQEGKVTQTKTVEEQEGQVMQWSLKTQKEAMTPGGRRIRGRKRMMHPWPVLFAIML